MSGLKTPKQIVLRVYTVVIGDNRGNDRIVGVEATSLADAICRFRCIGLSSVDPRGIERCLIIGDTEEARQALADWKPVTFADAKEMET